MINTRQVNGTNDRKQGQEIQEKQGNSGGTGEKQRTKSP